MTEDATDDRSDDSTDDDRRTFLQAVGSTAVAAGAAGTAQADDGDEGSDGGRDDGDGSAPSTVPLTHGVASGDVTARTAVVWARAAEAATLHVQYATDDSFERARRERTEVDEESDYTGQVRLTGLQSGTRYHYRVWATEDAEAGRAPKSATTGTFVTAPAPDEEGAVSFAWSGDTWGYGEEPIEPPFEGLRAIAERRPDFFLYLGDTIYADADTPAGQVTSDTPLDEALPIYRGKYREMRDPPADVAPRTYLRSVLESTSVYAMWDDHEVINNFAGSIQPLMPSGRQAFLEYWPIDESNRVTGSESGRLYRSFQWGQNLELFVLDSRQYRDPNVDLATKRLLGAEQMAWLKASLAESDATWKVIASTAPMGAETDTWATKAGRTGYESSLLEVVDHVEEADVSNVVVVAADVHYSQVGAYDPDDDGEYELHEAIAGPLGAYAGEPGELYPPLNPTEFFAKGDYFNFGTVSVSEDGETLTLGIYDESGEEQFAKEIRAGAPGGDDRGEDESAVGRGDDAPVRVASTFDEDADGWLVARNGGSDAPTYHATGGNPGGHVGEGDAQGGIAWYYQAPFKFLGDREPFYGGTLSFDVRQLRTDGQFDAGAVAGGDVALTSGDTTLVYDFRGESPNPGSDWTSFEVPLSADANWIDLQSREPFATESTFRDVLADLEVLRVRGEYRSGADESRLDNVVLSRD